MSEVTIRKDLRALEDQGLLRRTHGGAHLENPFVGSASSHEKAAAFADEKRRIGLAAAAHVEPRDTILIGSGTTMSHLARHLPTGPGLTVVTPALNVALELARVGTAEVLVLGGMLRASSTAVVGPHAEAILRDTACDTLFLGVSGVDPSFGLSTTTAQEAALGAAMIVAAHRVIVLADASKLGARGFRRIAPLASADLLITDAGADAAVVAEIEAKGVSVEVV